MRLTNSCLLLGGELLRKGDRASHEKSMAAQAIDLQTVSVTKMVQQYRLKILGHF